jgi:hypothetical protein
LQNRLTFPNLGFKINDPKLLWLRNSIIFKLADLIQTVIPAKAGTPKGSPKVISKNYTTEISPYNQTSDQLRCKTASPFQTNATACKAFFAAANYPAFHTGL